MAVALASAAGNQEDPNLSGGDIILPAPTSIASGDFRGHWLISVNPATGAPAVGTGMTDAGSDTDGSAKIRFSWKVAGGSEGSITHTTPGTESASAGYAFRATGTHLTTPVNAFTLNNFAVGTSPATLATVTTTVPDCLIVYLLFGGTVQPSMAVPSLHDRFWNAGVELGAMYSEVQASAGTTTARQVTWSGSSDLFYAIVALAPHVSITGTAAITLDPFVSSASGTVSSDFNGTAAIVLDPFTSSASGTVSVPSVSGSAGITLDPFVSTATGVVINGQYPTAVSANGRYIEDQHGDPWPVLGDSNIVIHTVPHATADEVETGKSVESYLDELVAHGLNSFWCKLVYLSSGGIVAQDVDGNDAFTGTPWQSSLNAPYWDNWEHIVQMAAERGITLFLFPTWLGIDDTEGDRVLMEAASDVQMEAWGAAVGARFAQYPNIIWMNGGDRASPSATSVERWKNIQDGIISAGANQLWGLHGRRAVLHSTYITSNGMTDQVLDLNTMYQNKEEPANDAATAWGEDIGPVIAYEMNYENEDQSGNLDIIDKQELRSQYYGTFMAGANGHVYGNNPRWHMDTVAAFAVPGISYVETWDDTDGGDDDGTNDFALFASFVTGLNGEWAFMIPDRTDTFLTSGEGTGATRSSARFNSSATTNLALAYRPHGGSATLTFDLTEFTAVDAVRIRKFDPIDGTYTTIGEFATTGSQSVGSLGTNARGDGDWVLVFEAVPNIQFPYWGIRIR